MWTRPNKPEAKDKVRSFYAPLSAIAPVLKLLQLNEKKKIIMRIWGHTWESKSGPLHLHSPLRNNNGTRAEVCPVFLGTLLGPRRSAIGRFFHVSSNSPRSLFEGKLGPASSFLKWRIERCALTNCANPCPCWTKPYVAQINMTSSPSTSPLCSLLGASVCFTHVEHYCEVFNVTYRSCTGSAELWAASVF